MRKLLFISLISFWVSVPCILSQHKHIENWELDYLCDSVQEKHKYDDLYLHFRPLPDVRNSVEDFVINKAQNKWYGSYTIKKYNEEKVTYKLQESELTELVNEIDIKRLLKLPISDSINLDLSKLEIGTSSNFILICYKGNIREIQYPVRPYLLSNKKYSCTYWQSNYIEKVIDLLTRKMKR